jgi:alpha-L-rhamnosidase
MTRKVMSAVILAAYLAAGLGPVHGNATAGPMAPTGLLLERLSMPLGIDSPAPAMSWVITHPEPEQYQAAYQVQVATSRAGLSTGQPDVWDSGKVESAESSNARYAGPGLAPNTVYYWRVRVWDGNDRSSPYSEPQMFVTGMGDGWRATPIWAARANGDGAAHFAFLRRGFMLPDKQIEHAIVHVTAVSPEPASQYVYRLYLNDAFVGCGPERGFDAVNRYNTYDIADYLNPWARNAVAALNYTAEGQKFLFQLDIRFADGTSETITSDASWKALDGDAIYVDGGNAGHNTFHYAPRENINALHYPFGWKTSAFDDSGWPQAVTTGPIENLRASAKLNEQKHIVEPVRLVERAPGHYFVDFGRSLLGGFRLHGIEGEAGQEVDIRLGQELLGPQTVRYAKRTGNTYREMWTLADGPQTISNWGYRAYRYAEVLGAPEGLDVANFHALALRQPCDPSESHFESSDFVLNDIWDMLKYSIQATGLDVYVDTHSRERRNYEGDAYINQLSQYTVERQYAFPRYSMEYLYYRPTWPTEYKQVSVMMAWEDYMYTGNADSLEKHYEVLQAKTLEPFINQEYLVEKPENAGSPWGRDLIDWPHALRDGYQFSERNTVINAFNYRAVELLGKIARVLGRDDEAARYTELAANLREAINEHFYDPEQGAYRDGKAIDHHALHANIFPVALGAAREAHLAPVAEHIFDRGMQCNLYGAQFVLEALYAADRGDLALKRMNAVTGNSWGYMMYRLGATIATEAWDASLKGNMSYSHGGWGSAPTNNIVRGMFGIQPVEPGFNTFQVRPQPGGVAWAQLTTPTIKGPIGVTFLEQDGAFHMTVSVPVNTRANVYVPRMGADHAEVHVNGEAQQGRVDGGFVLIENVGSGTHTFVR